MIARLLRLHYAFERWLDDADLTRLDRGLLKASQIGLFAAATVLILAVLAAMALHGVTLEDQ